MKRRFTLSPEVRDLLIERADTLAAKLVVGGLDKEDAGGLVALVTSESLEWALELAGMPEPAADAIGERVGELASGLALKVVASLKPDPEKLMARATEALRAGDVRKSKRLMDRAARVMARQAQDELGGLA